MKSANDISNKIISIEKASNIFNTDFRAKEKIVFTNGCFDILHKGHLHILMSAKALGSILVVGLNSDSSVRILKGINRPVKDEETRALLLAAMSFVDYIILFPEQTPASLIESIRPRVLVKGGDYKAEEIVGADFVIKNGGSVEIIPFLEGHSSSSLIQKGMQ